MAVRFPFRTLPTAAGEVMRPVLPIVVEDVHEAPIWSLADTGSLHNRFGMWLAELAGVDLTGGDEVELGVGGGVTHGVTVTTRLQLGEVAWEAPVTFCDPWPFGFGLLGQEGFFRWFDVRVRAAERWLECSPEEA